MIKFILITYISSYLSSGLVLADEYEGRGLVATCTGCHRVEDTSDGVISSFSLLEKFEFIAKMRFYKSAESGTSVMHQLAAGYTKAQIDRMADYLYGK